LNAAAEDLHAKPFAFGESSMTELTVRFVIGGVVISFFAVMGDVLKPKSFAGLFGAAPSVALATLGLTICADGKLFAAREARSQWSAARPPSLFLHVFVHAS
jgi:hypothetical protein